MSADMVPQAVFSECSIRFSKLLVAMNLSGGLLDVPCLSHLLLGHELVSTPDLTLSRVNIHPTRKEISTLVAGAFPGSLDEAGLSSIDAAIILAGIASVYASLGLQRKKALIIKELIQTLIPGLTQAKVMGAAEAGIHPSFGIAALGRADGADPNGNAQGVEEVLNILCQIYGIPESHWTRSLGSDLYKDNRDDVNTQTNGHLPEELLGNFILRSFGDFQIKADVLRSCIALCEALPDYNGMLHYCTTLLRTAGPGIAPSAETTDILVNLPREEQIQLATKISRTVQEAQIAGFKNIEAEYWDEFLVRGLYLMDSPAPLILQPHKRADIKTIKTKDQARDPFIHNPFLESNKAQKWPNLLATGDNREFVVALQNPFDFAITVEYLKIAAGEEDLGVVKTDLILKPFRTQSFSITGRLARAGSILVTGCIIKVQGCRERLFPIFSEAWTPSEDFKVKEFGFIRKQQFESRLSDGSSIGEGLDRFPQSAHIQLTAIPEQPILFITKSSVAEDSLMMLEGEQVILSITMMNTSRNIAADFIHISWFDSVSADLQRTLSQKGILPADLYEMEYQLMKLPAVTIEGHQPLSIAPGTSETFNFRILAKPGLTSINFQFDYANLSVSHLSDDETFFTRQVAYSLSVTVNASIQVQRLEILPFDSSPVQWNRDNEDPAITEERNVIHANYSTVNEYCLLLIDIRNSWPSRMSCSIKLRQDRKGQNGPNLSSPSNVTMKPGQVIRQVLQIPKIYISNPHKTILSMSPSRNRQFVVSTDRIRPDMERSIREVFWFRQALLDLLEGSWTTENDGGYQRSGMIDLRSVRMHHRMVEILRMPDMSLTFDLDGNTVKHTGRPGFEVSVDDFAILKTTLYNRSSRTISPLLRLQPSLADQPREISLDIGKRFAYSGVLQRPVPKLKPNQSYTLDLPICVLCAGEFEVTANVEEVQPSTEELDHDSGDKNFPIDDLERGIGRRAWIVGQTCRIVARNHELKH
jgi:trafficking protein particle complex subunit 9